jgi:hypothetical protein
MMALSRGLNSVDLALSSEHFTELYLTVYPVSWTLYAKRHSPVPLGTGSIRCDTLMACRNAAPTLLSHPGISSSPHALPSVLYKRDLDWDRYPLGSLTRWLAHR